MHKRKEAGKNIGPVFTCKADLKAAIYALVREQLDESASYDDCMHDARVFTERLWPPYGEALSRIYDLEKAASQ